MKGKIAFVLGAATGYVLGTRAGRARYEQIKRGAKAVWATPPVQSGVDAVKGVVDSQVEAAQRAVIRGGKNLFVTVTRRMSHVTETTTHAAKPAASNSENTNDSEARSAQADATNS